MWQVSSLQDMCDRIYGGGLFAPPLPAHMGPAPKRPILNRVKSEATFQRFSERFCRIGNKKKWRRFYFSKNNAVTRKGFR